MTDCTSLTAQYEQGGYLDKVPNWHLGDAAWKAGKIIDLLDRNALQPETVCDVGCGGGGVLAELQARLEATAEFAGYDISPEAISLCQGKENDRLKFYRKDFLTADHPHYDLLLLLDVFEHIPDYLSFLSTLRTGARHFIFHIPLDINVHAVARGSGHLLYMRSRYGHLHYFTRETALATLTDLGYRVLDYFFTWDGEIDGMPKKQPGTPCSRHFRRCLTYLLDQLLYRLQPGLLATMRPGCNLLVLATFEG